MPFDVKWEPPAPRTSRRRRKATAEGTPVGPRGRSLIGVDPVSGYEPESVDPTVWLEIKDAVRTACEIALPRTTYGHILVRSILTRYIAWAWLQGRELGIHDLLEPMQIECFIEQEPLAEATKGNYRSVLRQLGRALVGPPHFMVSVPRSTSRVNDPYSVAEVAALYSWVTHRPDNTSRLRLLTLMACSVGAGLTTAEICNLRGCDVEYISDAVRIHIAGRRPRTVWVEESWGITVFDHAFLAGDGSMMRFDRFDPATRSKAVSNMIDRQKRYDGLPKFSVQRFRSTWIVGLLDAGASPRVIADAAGIEADQVGRYIEFMADYDEDTYRSNLRGVD